MKKIIVLGLSFAMGVAFANADAVQMQADQISNSNNQAVKAAKQSRQKQASNHRRHVAMQDAEQTNQAQQQNQQ